MANEGRDGTGKMSVGQEKENSLADEHTGANKKITICIVNPKPQKKEKRFRWPVIFVSLIMITGIFATMPVQADSPEAPIPTAGPAPVNLGTAGDFVILAESGITTTVGTHITGDIGVYPIASGAITGFALTPDASGQYATSTLVTGKVYAAEYADPTPSKMLTAIGDKDIAYADAAGRAVDYNELYAGDITGQTLTPGCYKWTSVVLVSAEGVTIHGNPDDVWIFQTSQDLTVSSEAIVTLSGGAQASNIFWQVAGQVTLGTTSQFKGIILCATQVVIQTGATLDGRALAKTAVTLDANMITVPTAISGVSPLFIWANKTGGLVRLEWSGGAQPFDIFVSNAVDGTGFNFASPTVTGVTDKYYTFNVLGNGNSYSYMVLGEGDTTTPHPNMAFKFAKQITTPKSPNINWVALPYIYQYTALGAVAADIGEAITLEVRAWDQANQVYRSVIFDDFDMIWIGATTFALGPGDTVLIFCHTPGTWDMVGATNPGLALNIQTPKSPNINWVALPINHDYTNLGEVAASMGEGIAIEVQTWDVINQNYTVVIFDDFDMIWIGATTFAISPGDSVLIFCRNPGAWNPTETNP